MANKTAPKKGTKTLADFRAAHDRKFIIPEKIKAGIAQLGKGGWEYEAAFARDICGINTNDLADFRDMFEQYTFQTKGRGTGSKRVWAGSPELAKQMQDMQ